MRFFVPAIAPIARLPRWFAGAVVAVFVGPGFWSFADMAATEAGSGMPGGATPGGYDQPGELPPPGSMPSGAPVPQGAPSQPGQ